MLCISYLITIVIYTIVLATRPSEDSWYTLLRRWLATIFSMILSLALDLYFSSTVKWVLDEQNYQERRIELEMNEAGSNQNVSEAGKELMADDESRISEID